MARWRSMVGWCVALALPAVAQAQVDLTTLDKDMLGPRTQVLVLGSVHLSEIDGGVAPAALDALLDRLAAFKPDIVAIEAIGGEQCDLAARHPSVYGADYCLSTSEAQAATGLDVPAALAEVDTTLAAWPAQPTPAQRRRLAAVFLAANERASAYAQWLQLAPAERHAGDGLDAVLVAALAKIATSSNENYRIGSRLAARLGLPRVHPVDDHTGDNIRVADRKAFGQSIEQAWKDGRAALDGIERQEQALQQGSDLLPLYRFINRPENLAIYADVNAGAAMRAASPQHYPQIWVSGWEIRNLRMVANLQQTFRETPGARVLSIVGVSHKPWFDSWLGQLQGVESVDAQRVLQ